MTGITIANSVTTSVLAAISSNSIVDWVFVELRSSTDPLLVIDSRSALLQRDGDIVDLDGVSPVSFQTATQGRYYVSVKHRNHLGVMSQTPIDLSIAGAVIDFRLAATATYVLGASSIHKSQVDVSQGKAMWAGNALAVDGLGNYSIIYQGTNNDVNIPYQQAINAPNNFLRLPFYNLKGYFSGDINMNGEVLYQGTGNDIEFIYQNVINNHSGNILKQNFFTIKEQIPR